MLKPRSHLRHLAPYELATGLTVEGGELLQLAQNENYADASKHALAAARNACGASARYPDPDASGLRAAIAELHDLQPDRIVCARGAMELISLLATAYLEPGTSAVISEFGYLYFRSAIQLAGARVLQAPEPAKVVDPEAMADQVTKTTRMVFVANPGNPTGSFVPKSTLAGLRKALPESVVLVIDEAYAEFVEPDEYHPCFDMVGQGNTVVLRTFSKIYGLAGLRTGWGYFPAQFASLLRVVQQPNGISGPGQAAATAAVGDQQHIDRLRERTLAIRHSFSGSLRRLGLEPLPSQGNFVLVRFNSPALATDADSYLRAHAIAVRELHGYGLSNCLRITLGTEQQMQRMLLSLEQWIDQQ